MSGPVKAGDAYSAEEVQRADLALETAQAVDPVQRLNLESKEIWRDGHSRFDDWQEAVKGVGQSGAGDLDFIAQVQASNDPALVMHKLGSTEEGRAEAKRIHAMDYDNRRRALDALERGETYTPSKRMFQRAPNDTSRMSSKEFSRWFDKTYGVGGIPGRNNRR